MADAKKRSYHGSDTLPRRATNYAPPLGGRIELAVAQVAAWIAQVAAWIAGAKKPRVEIGGGSGSAGAANSGALPMYLKKIEVPNPKVGDIAGNDGETLKDLEMQSGAKIQITRDSYSDSATRPVDITGTLEQISKAEKLIQDVLDGNLSRNQSMSTSYSQQQGNQARPPTGWVHLTVPLQQPGCGYYSQTGAYPGTVAAQYNMNQPTYDAGYPPQPTSGGYATGWVQTSAQSNQQQQEPPPAGPPSVQGSGYYYGQQQQPPPAGPPSVQGSSSYAYNQQPAAGYYYRPLYVVYGGYNPPYVVYGGYNTLAHPGYGVTLHTQAGYGTQPPGSYNQGSCGQDLSPPPPPAGYGPPSAQPGYGGPSYGAPPPAQPNSTPCVGNL